MICPDRPADKSDMIRMWQACSERLLIRMALSAHQIWVSADRALEATLLCLKVATGTPSLHLQRWQAQSKRRFQPQLSKQECTISWD